MRHGKTKKMKKKGKLFLISAAAAVEGFLSFMMLVSSSAFYFPKRRKFGLRDSRSKLSKDRPNLQDYAFERTCGSRVNGVWQMRSADGWPETALARLFRETVFKSSMERTCIPF